MPDRPSEATADRLGLVEYQVEIRAGLQALVGAPVWYVRALELEEALSLPYRLEIELVRDTPIEVRALAGAAFELTMHREHDDAPGRTVRGIVLQAIDRGRFPEAQRVFLRVGPRLTLAELSVRSRIFQDMTAVDIARAVLDPYYTADRFDASRLQHEPRVRDYCVQFRETDLAFVRRILAEDGIAFAFDHVSDADQEVLVLLDDPSAFRGAGSSASGLGDDQASPLVVPVATLGNDHGEEEHATRFEWKRTVHPTQGVLEQWDWKAAEPQQLAGEVPPGARPPWVIGEQVLFGDRRLTEADGGTGPHVDDSLDVVQRHLHRQIRQAELAQGTTNVVGLAPGTTFEIEGHPDRELEQIYYVTRVTHRADCPQADPSEGSPIAGPDYENEIECVPLGVPYYATVPAKPRVFGPQTATVVGPASEEIHTDAFGRIQVRMHWDREQRDLETGTSAWLRVAQSWAGPGWGTVFIPRVGMEVIVAFLDGDPDRPMCVGCVYNGKNTPPYALPDEKTKSTIKTRSTPGGEGSNELRFEDARGSEEVYLHAQKDLVERVEHEHRTSVGASQSNHVGGSRKVDVRGNQDVVVGSTQSIVIQGQGIGDAPPREPAHVLDVTGAIEQHASDTVLVTAKTSITLQCGSSVIELTPSGIKLHSQTGAQIDLNAAIAMLASDAAVTLDMKDDGSLAVQNKVGSKLTVAEGLQYDSAEGATLAIDAGHALSTAGAAFEITDSVQSDASSFRLATQSASLELTDAAKLQGATMAALESGGGRVEATPGSAQVKAPAVEVSGTAAVSIVAATLKLN